MTIQTQSSASGGSATAHGCRAPRLWEWMVFAIKNPAGSWASSLQLSGFLGEFEPNMYAEILISF